MSLWTRLYHTLYTSTKSNIDSRLQRTYHTQHDNSFDISNYDQSLCGLFSATSNSASIFNPIWAIFFEQLFAFPWYIAAHDKTLSFVLVILLNQLIVPSLDTTIHIIPPYNDISQYKLWFWIIVCATIIFTLNIFNMHSMCLV